VAGARVTVLLLQLLTGLAGASALFLVAAGLTVIFGVTRVVNFSHGSLYMLGAYVAWTVLGHLPRDPLGFAAGVAVTALVLAALGAALEVSLLRRLYRAPELLQLLATFGVVLIVQDAAQAIWGADDLSLPRPPWMRAFVMLGAERFPAYDLFLIAAGPLVLGCLWLLLHRSRWGTLVRAATADREMVAALGVDQRLLFTGVFALGAGLAGLGGALALPDGSANLQLDLSTITDAFVVVVVGGLGSLAGAYLASVLIGVLQAIGILFVPKATLVIVFVVMAATLVLRPNGLLGRPGGAAREAEPASLVLPAPAVLRWAAAGALALLVLAPLLVGPFALSVLTEAMIALLFAASLHFMMGPGGMPSFGHAAWFGLGAYAAALATTAVAAPFPLALLGAPILAGMVAAAFGWFVVRLSGVYLAMLTLAFAQIVWAVAFQWTEITGGDNGILSVWPPSVLTDPRAYYWLALALSVGGALLLRRFLYAPFGTALRASRDSALRAEAIGLPTQRLRLAAFALAGAAAGLAGGLTAFSKGSVFPTYIGIGRSVDALLMVLLGGVQTISGPLVGALVYTGLYDALLQATDWWRLALGAAILLIVLVFPEGIAGAAQRVWRGRGA
jgi:branched-chain amino acid transport system permease protein